VYTSASADKATAQPQLRVLRRVFNISCFFLFVELINWLIISLVESAHGQNWTVLLLLKYFL
jgi:hypothetical protein